MTSAHAAAQGARAKRSSNSENRKGVGRFNRRFMTTTQKIIYWFATIILALGLLGTGIQQLLRVEAVGALGPPFVWGIVQLGYPVYVLTILGVWKLLGAVAILVPKYPLLKEWAYAGLFFLLTGAIFSHIASNHPWYESIAATTLLILTILSWYLRPGHRKLSRPEVINA